MTEEPTPEPQEPEPTGPALSALPEFTGRYFDRIDWSAFLVATLAAFIGYFMTMAPTVTLEDSGELAVAADYLGVPHPPGYPIWTVICWIFTEIFSFVPYRGWSNPAWAVGLVSVVFGALTAGTAALLIRKSGHHLLHFFDTRGEIPEAARNVISWTAGVTASLAFAFSSTMWSQSVIVEVYSLNAFFLVLILLLLYMWTWHPTDKLLYVTLFMFGLGLTNYQVLLFIGLALGVAIALRDQKLTLSIGVAAVPFFYLIMCVIKPSPHFTLPHPTSTKFAAIMFVNFAILISIYLFAPKGRTAAIAILLGELGFAFYLFMPISSEQNPPMNWGYPRTFEGFIHATSRGQYERIEMANMGTYNYIRQIGVYLKDVRNTFSIPLAVLAILPFAAWSVRVGKTRFRLIYPALALTVPAIILVSATRLVGGEALDDPRLPIPEQALLLQSLYTGLLVAVMGIAGLGILVLTKDLCFSLFKRISDDESTFIESCTSALTLIGLAITCCLFEFIAFQICKDGDTPGSVRLVLISMMLIPFIMMTLEYFLEDIKLKLNMDFSSHVQHWLMTTVSGFLVMSALLIALANLKFDIQDYFIQRVKFISSHGIYTIWVGYGFIVTFAATSIALTRVAARMSINNPRFFGACVASLLAIGAVTPPLHRAIKNNTEYNRMTELVGSPAQNGHDFGWQFGYYGIRGANGISEELIPEEEPLPNPEYPPEMTTNAIFFGGTDPGRFVPTYMIYSAGVRSDVFLITQNALADNTYMNVMRDLYGDDIWIPAISDSNESFRKYLEDVRTGRRPASADIKIEGGRVQVMGVGGVMIINGYLAEMIFEHNKARHDFYVEESYVLDWMYNYLTPHGIMMKINRDPVPVQLPGSIVRDDLDFWDWYTRRLVNTESFKYDVVARKSFSKLRSAIAGLYANHAQRTGFKLYGNEAAYAFQQSLALYNLSPEANFRLAELYIRQNKFAQARSIMEAFQVQDPENVKIADFLRQVDNFERLNKRKGELEAYMQGNQGQSDVTKAIELMTVYRDVRNMNGFLSLGRSILANQNLDPRIYMRLAQLFAETKQYKELGACLERYLKHDPSNLQALIDLGAVYVMQQNPNKALPLLGRAVKVNRNQALTILSKDPRFTPLHKDQRFAKLFQNPAPQTQPGGLPRPGQANPANGVPQGAFGPLR